MGSLFVCTPCVIVCQCSSLSSLSLIRSRGCLMVFLVGVFQYLDTVADTWHVPGLPSHSSQPSGLLVVVVVVSVVVVVVVVVVSVATYL